MRELFNNNNLPQAINLKKEIAKVTQFNNRYKQSSFFKDTSNGFQSSFFDPYSTTFNYYRNLKTADGFFNREVDCRTLRRVSKKASIINLCILNIQRKIKPFLKASYNKNISGFVIHKKEENPFDVVEKKSNERAEIEKFLINTGLEENSDRDNFQKFCLKIVRDVLEIDQVSTEIGFTKAGQPYAFWAVDGATIERVLPNQDNPFNIKFIQVIDNIPQAYFPEGSLIFDFQNPRSDIYHSFYGYSYVEQAIDLITSEINAFNYNAGFFTDNKLPRGMLLLNGNANQESIQEIEDYICDVMSGGASNQWHIPIIPAGTGKSGDNASAISWVNLNGTNREMEFQNWLDFLISEIVALFGCSVDELGLQINKSQPVFEHNKSTEINASKSQILNDVLSFLQTYLNRIITKFYPEYEISFIGYEKEDPKAMLDITKGELDTYKVVNEIRKEKGLPPLKSDWANECPANPQLVQMYQSAKMNEQQEGGMEDVGDMEEDTEGGFGEDTENSENENINGEAWDEVENNNNSDDVEKSIQKSQSKLFFL